MDSTLIQYDNSVATGFEINTTGGGTFGDDVAINTSLNTLYSLLTGNAQGDIGFRSDASAMDFTRNGTSYIRTLGGSSSSLQITTANNGFSNPSAFFTSSGGVNLYFGGSLKFATTSTGIDISGSAIADAYGTNVQTLTETAGAIAWDMSSGSKAKVTIDETSVITITNMPEGAEATIRIVQGDAGDDNVTFVLSGATVEWRGDDTDLTDASGAIDYISVVNMDGFLGVTLGSGYVTQ